MMKVSSIKLKFAIISICISLVSFGLAALLSTRWMAEEIEEDYQDKVTLIKTHVLLDLEESMPGRAHKKVFRTLDIYKNYKEVEEVRFFDLEGKEVFTQNGGHPGAQVEEVLKTGTPARFNKVLNERNVITFVTPIQNKTECHSCHGKEDSIRGALLLSLSREGMERYIGEKRRGFLLFFGLIALGVISASLFTVNRLVLKPLEPIQKGAEVIGGGDFLHRIPVKSADEIGALAEQFNLMAKKLEFTFNELELKRKQIDEQLDLVSRSQKEWQETFDCITDPIAIMTSDCTVLKANRAFREIFQMGFKIEHPFLKNGSGHRRCEELFGRCLLSDCPHKTTVGEQRPVLKEIRGLQSGKIYEVSMFPYYSPQKDFIGSIAILKDITEKKESEMRNLLRERLVTLGQIVSGIAHEINNPMATIKISTEGLLRRVRQGRFDQHLFESYLGIIEEEVQRSRKITNSMLSYVRGRESGKQDINIPQVLDKAIDILSFQGRMSGIELLKDYDDGIQTIRGDESEIHQVFLAVINNAIEAMEGEGKLTIETVTQGKDIFVKISDTGPGIHPDVADQIFTPFVTTKADKGGTGLGLFITKKIIEEHGGNIEVFSKEGQGVTLAITFPI